MPEKSGAPTASLSLEGGRVEARAEVRRVCQSGACMMLLHACTRARLSSPPTHHAKHLALAASLFRQLARRPRKRTRAGPSPGN